MTDPTPPKAWCIAVCLTCGAIAQWPFCEHRQDHGRWFTYVAVRTSPGRWRRLKSQMRDFAQTP